MTGDESSWVVSLIQVGNLLVALPAGYIVDKIGRKILLLAAGPVLLVSWVIVLTTRTVHILYVVRFIQGLSMGIVYTILPLYLGEIAQPNIRGSMGYFFPGIWYAGNLYDYVFGPYVSYQTLAWISMAPPLVFIATFVWIPESPYFLLMRGRTEEARKSLEWLREGDVEEELSSMMKSLEDERCSMDAWRELLGSKEGRKSLSIVILVAASYVMAGGTAMFSYATDTFAKTQAVSSVAHLSPDLITILMGSLVLLLLPPSAVLVDRMGRRPVLVVSSVGSTLFLAVTSVYYYIKFQTEVDTSRFDWLPYFTIINYTLLIACGTEAVVPLLQAELFANKTRGAASALSFLFLTCMSFFCLKMYQVLADNVGLYFLYGCFSVASALGAVYIYFCVPETKGLTFEEIQNLIKKDVTESSQNVTEISHI